MQSAADRSDLMTRVFHLKKLNGLKGVVKGDYSFCPYLTLVSVFEDQKRGHATCAYRYLAEEQRLSHDTSWDRLSGFRQDS